MSVETGSEWDFQGRGHRERRAEDLGLGWDSWNAILGQDGAARGRRKLGDSTAQHLSRRMSDGQSQKLFRSQVRWGVKTTQLWWPERGQVPYSEGGDCEGVRSMGGQEDMEMGRVDNSVMQFGCEWFNTHKVAGEGGRTGEGGVLLYLKMAAILFKPSRSLFSRSSDTVYPSRLNCPRAGMPVSFAVVYLVHVLWYLTHL